MEQQPKPTPFEGFAPPTQNHFPMMWEWTDITSRISSLAELKLVEYVIKHTWAQMLYGLSLAITNDEFMHGRKDAEGNRLDLGTGLAKNSVIAGLRLAIEDGLLECTIDDAQPGNTIKSYKLHMRSSHSAPGANSAPPIPGSNLAPGANLAPHHSANLAPGANSAPPLSSANSAPGANLDSAPQAAPAQNPTTRGATQPALAPVITESESITEGNKNLSSSVIDSDSIQIPPGLLEDLADLCEHPEGSPAQPDISLPWDEGTYVLWQAYLRGEKWSSQKIRAEKNRATEFFALRWDGKPVNLLQYLRGYLRIMGWWADYTKRGYLDTTEMLAVSRNKHTPENTPRILEALYQIAELDRMAQESEQRRQEREQRPAMAASAGPAARRPQSAYKAGPERSARHISSFDDPNYQPNTAYWKQPDLDNVRREIEADGIRAEDILTTRFV